MCLEFLKGPRDIPKNEPVRAWKAFDVGIPRWSLKPLFHVLDYPYYKRGVNRDHSGNGFYVYSSLKHLRLNQKYAEAWAQVLIWGRCQKYSNGYTAEYVKIVRIAVHRVDNSFYKKLRKRYKVPLVSKEKLTTRKR